MGIRTLLSRTAAGAAHASVPAVEAAASTVRVPFTLTTALREATAGLRQRLAPGGRPAGPARTGALATTPGITGALATTPGITGPRDLAALLGLDDPGDLPAALGLTDQGDLTAALGLTGPACDRPAAFAPHGATGPSGPPGRTPGGTPAAARHPARPPRTRTARGGLDRPWTRRARDYLTYVLALLPRPRPAHTTTITVYITTPGGPLGQRPDGSAPHRRRGQDPQGPEPDATA
ncbi:hypothetical protein [Streptomyces djakartensis]|uniref:hypothetical protein n=1 Tax=Streptomyces djakartensis TaxID=68193 RepID=UPI0034DF30C6